MDKDQILRKHEDTNKFHLHESDRAWVLQAMQEYAELMVRKGFQSIIDYELENGRTPICNDEERGASEYATIFFTS